MAIWDMPGYRADEYLIHSPQLSQTILESILTLIDNAGANGNDRASDAIEKLLAACQQEHEHNTDEAQKLIEEAVDVLLAD